jgi:DNA-binding MarR family transcriptional regulator
MTKAEPTPPNADAAGEAWRLMGDLVLNNEVRDQVSEALGMSFGRTRALRRIATRSMPMGELAALLGIDPPYMTIIVDEFESLGLVERHPHPTDRRAKLVVATRRGKEMARRAEAILDAAPLGLRELSKNDADSLLRILRRATETPTTAL